MKYTEQERRNLSITLAAAIVIFNEVVEDINEADLIKFTDKHRLMKLAFETRKFENKFYKAIVKNGGENAELQFYRKVAALEKLVKIVQTLGGLDLTVITYVAEYLRDNDLNEADTVIDLNDVLLKYQHDDIMQAIQINLESATPEMLEDFPLSLSGIRNAKIIGLKINALEDYTPHRKRPCKHLLTIGKGEATQDIEVTELGTEQILTLNNFVVKKIDAKREAEIAKFKS